MGEGKLDFGLYLPNWVLHKNGLVVSFSKDHIEQKQILSFIGRETSEKLSKVHPKSVEN